MYLAHQNRGEGWTPVYLSPPTGQTAKISAHPPGEPDAARPEHELRDWVPLEHADRFATAAAAQVALDEWLALQGLADHPWPAVVVDEDTITITLNDEVNSVDE